MKKALIVVSQTEFQPVEYGDTREEIEKAGIEVSVASFDKTEAIGKDGSKINVDVSIKEANVEDYDAVVLIGGHGARLQFLGNQDVIGLVQSADNAHKVVAAICIAPRVLAEARLLRDRRATVHNGDNESAEFLAAEGATYTEEDVVVDTRIITANGPAAAKKFGQAIAKVLKEGVVSKSI
ncbi:MAG: DJ-1/PfpI family protein [Candidatus Woesearchaeota archaeon]